MSGLLLNKKHNDPTICLYKVVSTDLTTLQLWAELHPTLTKKKRM